MDSTNHDPLPSSTSPHLHLAHPTPEELVQISTNTFASWHDTLPLPAYLAESLYLSTVPLAKDNGLTTWILVDKRLPPNARPILSSCESYRKRALTSDSAGNVSDDAIVHGVASVFCAPPYRRRGYAARLMQELARVLRDWQTTAEEEEEDGKRVAVVGSILYSDIGKTFYANLGWSPHPRNTHVAFAPQQGIPKPTLTKAIAEEDLAAFCEEDEAMVRRAMARPLAPAPDGVEKKKMQQRVTIVPDCDHMLWHLAKEAFATERLFGKVPRAKGAIAGGAQGRRVWAIWTHRYYSHPDAVAAAAASPEYNNDENVLYILRLVVQGDESADGIVWDDQKEKGKKEEEEEEEEKEQARSLTAVLQAAQAEAAEWRLDRVVMWNPSPWVRRMITQSGLEHAVVEREEDAIASGLWYDENGGTGPAPLWMNNEHYAWC